MARLLGWSSSGRGRYRRVTVGRTFARTPARGKLHGTRTTLDRLTAPKPRIPKQPVGLRLGLAGAK